MTNSDYITVPLKAELSLYDESFNKERLQKYLVQVSYSGNDLVLCIADQEADKIIALEYYLIPDSDNFSKETYLNHLFDNHLWLKEPLGINTKLLVSPQLFTCIPDALFEENNLVKYYSLACKKPNQSQQVRFYKHTALGMVVVYTLPTESEELLGKLASLNSIKIVPACSSFIEGLIHTQTRTAQPTIYLFAESKKLTISIWKDGSLQYLNTFTYTSPEDSTYYVLLVMQEYQLDPEKDKVTIWGNLMPDAAILQHLQKYVRYVLLGKRPAGINYTYKIEDIFQHRFFELYSLYFC